MELVLRIDKKPMNMQSKVLIEAELVEQIDIYIYIYYYSISAIYVVTTYGGLFD